VDCCASAADENEATAISPATADAVFPDPISGLSSMSSIGANDRSDPGAIACPIATLPD
jgi:hypothetical protein